MSRRFLAASALAAVAAAFAMHAYVAPSGAVAVSSAEAQRGGAFRHAPGADATGYFMPTRPVRAGRFRLSYVHLGGVMEYRQWERGQRLRTYSPVMAVFRGPGGEQRVLATAYDVTRSSVTFRGVGRGIGPVNIQMNLGPDGTSARGVVTAGGSRTATGFTHTVGD